MYVARSSQLYPRLNTSKRRSPKKTLAEGIDESGIIERLDRFADKTHDEREELLLECQRLVLKSGFNRGTEDSYLTRMRNSSTIGMLPTMMWECLEAGS